MPRGYPDYNSPASNIGAVSFDSAELAARLGSLSRIDRLGSVIYQDNFSESLSGWGISKSTQAVVNIVSTPVFDGSGSLHIGILDTSGNLAGVSKYIPVHDVSRAGLELTFGIKYALGYGLPLRIISSYAVSTFSTTFQLTIYPDPGKITIHRFTGSLPLVETDIITGLPKLNPNTVSQSYHHIKLVVDPEQGKYVRLYFDDTSMSLSQYSSNLAVAGSYNSNLVQLVVPTTTLDGDIYIDNLILTLNEP